MLSDIPQTPIIKPNNPSYRTIQLVHLVVLLTSPFPARGIGFEPSDFRQAFADLLSTLHEFDNRRMQYIARG